VIGEADGKRRALGRGLGALLPPAPKPSAAPVAVAAVPDPPATQDTGGPARVYFVVGVEEIEPSPEQPRRIFAEAELEELAASIRAHGVIQPLLVRARTGGGFTLIAGERRWRASQRAGLLRVPVVVQDVAPREAFERALIENIQRADLNAMEEAEAYARLVTEYGLTQEQVAEQVGKERSTVANSMRLLKLPAAVRGLVEEDKLSMGHARALLALGTAADMETVARQVVAKGLSVRATEQTVRQRLGGPSPSARPEPPAKNASVRDVENRLTRSLGSQVSLSEDKNGKGGTLAIRYADLDDLDRLLERLLPR
jgi:ParB family transcriptional regulator, chromosome partitioning protein